MRKFGQQPAGSGKNGAFYVDERGVSLLTVCL